MNSNVTQNSFLLNIQSIYPSLTKAEKKVLQQAKDVLAQEDSGENEV